MDAFAELTGRRYGLFEYVGDPEAERVIVLMGSGAETVHETVELPDGARREGRRAEGPALSAVLARARSWPRCPRASARLAVLDRTKEPGAPGDPLYLDVMTALAEAQRRGRLALRGRSRASSPAATACRRRSSRRRW